MIGIPKEASALVEAAARESGRALEAAKGVHVIETQEGYRLEATDCRMMVVLRGPENSALPGAAVDQVQEALEEGLAAADKAAPPAELTDYLVPAETWKAGFTKGGRDRKSVV